MSKVVLWTLEYKDSYHESLHASKSRIISFLIRYKIPCLPELFDSLVNNYIGWIKGTNLKTCKTKKSLEKIVKSKNGNEYKLVVSFEVTFNPSKEIIFMRKVGADLYTVNQICI